MAFPSDSYTPFGYLANPYHRARTYSDVEGGLLRSTDGPVGFGWVEPTAREPLDEGAIVVVLRWNDRTYQTRSDFSRLGLESRHHTSALFTYDWMMDGARGAASFALSSRDTLTAEILLTNSGPLPLAAEVIVLARVCSESHRWNTHSARNRWFVQNRDSNRTWSLGASKVPNRLLDARAVKTLAQAIATDNREAVGFAFDVELGPGGVFVAGFGLDRSVDGPAAPSASAEIASAVCAARKAADDLFYEGVALPTGDWPDTWKRGWIYDLETTRACIFPSGGIFKDEWLSWMVTWPRVVVAEGSLDAARYSYADPSRALRLVRSMFANAVAPNVPCAFQGGEPNMVAKDGTQCGTSPAWCLPFHNLKLLFLRTLDRDWLREIAPFLAAYLDYWLANRTDEDGWVVYKCTWEAGEDCSPRLDPLAEGDEVISRWVRPVELQATLSQSAAILADFYRELGDAEGAGCWETVAASYAAKTQQLWDETTGRYRDLDKRTGRFLVSPGQPSYWKTDPVRFSALSLTPIVAGLASKGQLTRLAAEIEFYDAAPWCLWPSWSFVVGEAATAAGWFGFAGRFARRIVDRVYASNDRRTLADAPRPTPGAAPEFWPLDLAEFNGSDAYGWGATTTSLWVRQIFGFLEAESSAGLDFILAPSLPPALLARGRRFGFTNFPYRGWRLDIAYEVPAAGLMATIESDRRFSASIEGPDGRSVPIGADTGGRITFPVTNGEAFRVALRTDDSTSAELTRVRPSS